MIPTDASDRPASPERPRQTTVAIVAAKNSSKVGRTVAALLSSGVLDEVVVIDDGSTDDTAKVALDAGATVLRFDLNRGKGAALAVGIDARPTADRYLLVDADLAETAAATVELIEPVADGRADLAIAEFPPAGGRGGLGRIKQLSRSIVRRLCDFESREPLSGQRCIDGDLARSLRLAPRFGVEVGMTVDAVRAGARVVEMPLPLDHDHTGRSWRGFRHRIGQGVDIVRAAVTRLGTAPVRIGLLIGVTVVLIGTALAFGGRSIPSTPTMPSDGDRPLLVVLIAHSHAEDVRSTRFAGFDGVAQRASATLSSRVPGSPADVTSAAATLGAGAPLGVRMPQSTEESGEATGLVDDAAIDAAVPMVELHPEQPGGAAVVRTDLENDSGSRSYGTRGALGTALHESGRRVAYVGARVGAVRANAPGALAVADEDGRVDSVYPGLVRAEPAARSADIKARVADVGAALSENDVVLVDTGSATEAIRRAEAAEEAAAEAPESGDGGDNPAESEPAATPEEVRQRGVRGASELVAALRKAHPQTRMLLVAVSPYPRWFLTWVAAAESAPGSLGSPSTRRSGEVVLTDVSSTVLDAVGVEQPDEMIGRPMTSDIKRNPVATINDISLRTEYRDAVYVPMIFVFVSVQALTYFAALVALRLRGTPGVIRRRTIAAAQWVAVLSVAFVVATFVYVAFDTGMQRPAIMVPGIVFMAVGITAVAFRMHRSLLSPLIWICGLATLVLSIDAVTAGTLEHISLLGYSPATAARYYGMGNMGYALLGGSAIVVATALMADAPNRAEGLVRAGCLFAWVLVVDVAPSLGADFGGAITLAPVFVGLLLAWSGIRWTPRATVLAVIGSLAVVVGAAAIAVLAGGDTHIGSVSSGGISDLVETIRRKGATNLRVMRITTWSWMVPIVVIFMVGAVLRDGGLRLRFGTSTTWRYGFYGLMTFGVIGGALNDSGVVIPALVLVIAGALLMMLRAREPFSAPRHITEAV